jgi:hypothetical protein
MIEIIGLFGIVCCGAAIWLQWNLQTRLSYLENRYKDGRINSAQMSRGMNWAKLAPIFFTLLGAVLMLGAVGKLVG